MMLSISLHSITKRFPTSRVVDGSVLANDGAELRVKRGEIHALVGENGAGKSTLMNILYGMYQPDAGEIRINGKHEVIHSPTKAIALGIGMVHQHFMLIPPLTVTENIILGNEPTGFLSSIDHKKAEQTITEIAKRYRLTIDPSARVESLSVGVQQRVEILKVLYRNADILILDEPTPVLTPQEIEELFATLRGLREQGKTIILITHKLNEVLAISDTVTVMRRGKTVAEVETKSMTKAELARLMVGKEVEFKAMKASAPSAEPALVVKNVSALNNRQLPAVRNVSFSVARGEIFGIAGVEGNGQSELVQAITGLRKSSNGQVLIDAIDFTNRYAGTKIAHVPEDRTKWGLVPSFSLEENLILGRQREKTFASTASLNHQAIERYVDTVIEQFDVRPTDKTLLGRNLSGGNQQKLIIGRELSKEASVIVASQPTRGLDIGAIDFVHTTLLNERNKGKAILLVSSDLEELLKLSDRIAVMYEGEIVAIFPAERTNEYELGLYMTGAKKME